MNNLSVKFIVLSGLQEARGYRPLYFVLTLILYVTIIAANLNLILNVSMEKSLHEPMYIFLSNLCANGLCGTTGFYPKFLLDLLSDAHTITYGWCITQAYVIYTSVMCEITILTLMSYDRYVAICKPLQYHSILTPHAVFKLLVLAWTYPLLTCAVAAALTLRIPICRFFIQKLYCDNPSIIKLGCFETTVNKIWGAILISFHLMQFVFILFTYYNIIRVCATSSEGRAKFTKTCVPHILVIVIFIATTLFDLAYGWNGSLHFPVIVRSALATQFLILPPILNPAIYGFQLPQIRKALFRQSCKNKKMNNNR